MIVGFVGVAVLIGPETLLGGGERVVAQLAFLAAALSYAFSGVVGRRFVRLGITPVQSTFGQMCAASLFMAPLALIVEQPWTAPMPNTTQILAMLGLALMSTAIAFLLFFRILARAGATNVMLVTLLVPVTAILIAGVFLGERLEPRNFLGMGFIALGLGLIDGRPIGWIRARLLAFFRARRSCAKTRPGRIMILRRLALGFALFCGVLASQLPEFAQQYRQRLGGALDELTAIVAQFDADAAERRHGSARRRSPRSKPMPTSSPATAAAPCGQTIHRRDRLAGQDTKFRTAGPFVRLAVFAEDFDPQIARRAWAAFEPATPVTAEGFACAGAGALVGYSALRLLAAPFRRRRRTAPA